MFIYLGIIAFVALRGSNGQESCVTVSGGQGTCIAINECKPIFTVFIKPGTLTPLERGDLKKAKCGTVGNRPKVCCPSSTQVPIPPRSGDVSAPSDVTNHPNLRLINNEDCGLVTESRIIRGTKTTVLEFPWMALLGYEEPGKSLDWKCGGTLINEKYVLTAAHCVTGLPRTIRLSTVRIGEHDIDKERDCDLEDGKEIVCGDKYQDISIKSFHFHSGYGQNRYDDDIALVRLNGVADFRRNNAAPICLPVGPDTAMRSKKVIVTGWGRTEYHVPSPDLLKVTLPLVPTTECARIYDQRTYYWNKIRITHKQLCAGGKNGMDSCKGDSGGPMQYPGVINDEPKWIQYGIVSFGSLSCQEEGLPGVYTKIDHYLKWMLDTMTA